MAVNGNSWWGHLVQFFAVTIVVVTATFWITNALGQLDKRIALLEQRILPDGCVHQQHDALIPKDNPLGFGG